MTDLKLKNSVYAVVDTVDGKIVAASENREQAREDLQFYKGGLEKTYAQKYKIAKLSVIEKFVR